MLRWSCRLQRRTMCEQTHMRKLTEREFGKATLMRCSRSMSEPGVRLQTASSFICSRLIYKSYSQADEKHTQLKLMPIYKKQSFKQLLLFKTIANSDRAQRSRSDKMLARQKKMPAHAKAFRSIHKHTLYHK